MNHDKIKQILESHHCILKDELSDSRFSFECSRGHQRTMTKTSFYNKQYKIQRGEASPCALCDQINMAMKEDLNGHQIITYESVMSVTYKCGNCGAIRKTNMKALRKSTGVCNACQNESRKTSTEDVAKICEEYGFKLISYQNNKHITAICPCGSEFIGALNDIKRGRKCATCAPERRSQTNSEKYGASNPFASELIKDKIKEKNIEKYGVDHHMKVPQILEKTKQTNLNAIGVEYAFTQPYVYEKIRATHLKIYGVSYPLQRKAIQEQIEESCMKRYGVRRPFMSEEIREKGREKAKETMIEKYGFPFAMQNVEIFKRALSSSFRTKKFIFPSGKEVNIMGFESQAITYLLQSYDEKEIEVDKVPSIQYIDSDNKSRVYHPDIFLPEEKCLIEVKSCYTLYCEFDKNMSKFDAVKKEGFMMRLIMFEKIDDIEPLCDLILE